MLSARSPQGALKKREDEPIFVEPWHALAKGMADLPVGSGVILQSNWRAALSAEIKPRTFLTENLWSLPRVRPTMTRR
jgi:hypothetical protein